MSNSHQAGSATQSISIVIFGVIVILSILIGLYGVQRTVPPLAAGEPVGWSKLPTLQAATYTEVSKDTLKPTILVFWATWCGACKIELPLIDSLSKTRYKEVRVVGISVDDTWNRLSLKKRTADKHLSFEMRHDSRQVLSRGLKIVGLPTSVVLDRHGVPAAVFTGTVATHLDELDLLVKSAGRN